MNKFQLFSQLNKMSDKELVKFAETMGLSISSNEAKKLRNIFSGASIQWLTHGIPKEVLAEAKSVLGSSRYKKLLQFIS
ncbi:MAG: isopropylmalate synthase [Solibacillus sp.]